MLFVSDDLVFDEVQVDTILFSWRTAKPQTD